MKNAKPYSVSLSAADRAHIDKLRRALGRQFPARLADAQVVRFALAALAKKESVSLR